MKKYVRNTLSGLLVLVMISSGSHVTAQIKDGLKRSIIINNGDTLVNGKKFSDLNRNEQARLRKEFREMENSFRGEQRFNKDEELKAKLRVWMDDNEKDLPVLFWNDSLHEDLDVQVKSLFPGDFRAFRFNGDTSVSLSFHADTLINNFNFDGLDSNLRRRVITMHRELAPREFGGIGWPGIPGRGEIEKRIFRGFPDEKNASTFNYNYIDKDGISSRMNIRLSDAGKVQLKEITGSEVLSEIVEIHGLTIFPDFSNGKMSLSFTTDSRGAARVEILDRDMKPVFTDAVSNLNGIYIRQFSLPGNGIYYITIRQDGSWFVKKMIKE